jgi:hypothetical protein
MDERLRRTLHEAEQGDLRPQKNPAAVVSALAALPQAAPELEQALAARFLTLSRPIRDASAGPRPDQRLQDAGSFFYLLEASRRVMPRLQVRQLLWMLLDHFGNLDEASYDELYLWCIVELSRSDRQALAVLWPQVLTLDLQYRAAAWQRPPLTQLVEQPYRLTDLVFYFYVLYTLGSGAPLLGDCLEGLAPQLSAEQLELARRALRELAVREKRPVFGDALGLLSEQRQRRRAERRQEG